MLTLLSPSHHDSAFSELTIEKSGMSLAAESIAAAAMHDGQYSKKLASAYIRTLAKKAYFQSFF